MKFRKAVERTADIADHLRNGLDALSKAHQDSVNACDPKRIEGSVNIDAALQPTQPNATRWDYAIGYRLNSHEDKAFFAEYHRAQVDQVERVLSKKQWLDDWMSGTPLDQIPDRQYLWVSAGPIRIPPNAPQRRMLSACGVRLVRRLKLR